MRKDVDFNMKIKYRKCRSILLWIYYEWHIDVERENADNYNLGVRLFGVEFIFIGN